MNEQKDRLEIEYDLIRKMVAIVSKSDRDKTLINLMKFISKKQDEYIKKLKEDL